MGYRSGVQVWRSGMAGPGVQVWGSGLGSKHGASSLSPIHNSDCVRFSLSSEALCSLSLSLSLRRAM